MPPRTLKYKQGQLDGLCGIYSVVNALNHLLENRSAPAFSEDLFEAVMRSIPRRMYPDVLFRGLRVDELQKIARAATRHLDHEWTLQVSVRQPFAHRTFSDQASFLSELESLVDQKPTAVILGIEWNEFEGHWTVLKDIRSDQIRLIDSDGLRSLKRKATSIVGRRKARFCPEETTLFTLKGIQGKAV